MTLAPDDDLLKAAIDALRGDQTLAPLVRGRILDRVPEKPAGRDGIAYPYISIGPTQVLDAGADCIDAVEVSIQFDVWSQGDSEAYTSVECRKILEAIRKALHNAALDLTDNALAEMRHALSTTVRDPDGVTNHGIIQFTAIVETPTQEGD